MIGLVASFCFCTACEKKHPPVPAPPPDHTYVLRGQVTGLPNPPKQFLRIHHEAVPEFIGHDGKPQPMEEMEMEFPFLSPNAQTELKGIQLNDLVRATLEVRWKSEEPFLITSIEKLPPGTDLKLGAIKTEP
jgi:hypothetical protein